MLVSTEYVDLPLPGNPMRTFVGAPKAEGQFPGIWCYSDIFQLTSPMIRFCVRLAGYGFVAAAPEIYRRIEPPGTTIPFDDSGRTRGLENAQKTPVAHFDAACRAALQPDVRATACWYGTGIHNGKLGQDADAGSLARASEIRGELLMIFGTEDPHIPSDAREIVDRALKASGVRYEMRLFPAEHAFGRDLGPRFDPEATDQAFAATVSLFRRTFSS